MPGSGSIPHTINIRIKTKNSAMINIATWVILETGNKKSPNVFLAEQTRFSLIAFQNCHLTSDMHMQNFPEVEILVLDHRVWT